MKNTYLLWLLWGAMIISVILKQKIEVYMGIAIILLPILIVILQLQEEISNLKEEIKYQKKFITDRIMALSDKVKELSENFEKKIIVDFAEFAKNSSSASPSNNFDKNNNAINAQINTSESYFSKNTSFKTKNKSKKKKIISNSDKDKYVLDNKNKTIINATFAEQSTNLHDQNSNNFSALMNTENSNAKGEIIDKKNKDESTKNALNSSNIVSSDVSNMQNSNT